jgi:hypothetical protein
VDVRATILALDCDDPALQEEVEAIETDLRAEGFGPIVVQSGGEGRLHRYWRVRSRLSRSDAGFPPIGRVLRKRGRQQIAPKSR